MDLDLGSHLYHSRFEFFLIFIKFSCHFEKQGKQNVIHWFLTVTYFILLNGYNKKYGRPNRFFLTKAYSQKIFTNVIKSYSRSRELLKNNALFLAKSFSCPAPLILSL